MKISFYDSTVPAIEHSLTSLQGILDIGHQFALEQGIAESDMLSKKLYDDMFDLRMQVMAINLLVLSQGALLVGQVKGSPINPEIDDFAGLQTAIDAMLSDLRKIDASVYNARANDPIECTLRIGLASFESCYEMMRQWAMPHLYFHVTTAYDILRHNGAPLGKSNYLGKINMSLKSP